MAQKAVGKVRLSDIAEATRVSVATVSMALANHPAIRHATRVAIHQAARELGYRKPGVVSLGPGLGGMGVQASRAVHLGYIAVDKVAAQIHEENFSPLVQVLMRQTTRMGVRMQMASITVDTPLPEAAGLAARFAEGLDGLLVCGEVRAGLLGMLEELGVPLVVLGACAMEPEDPGWRSLRRLSFDIQEMARTAVRYLLSRGKKRIALMNGVTAGQKGFWSDLWVRGYGLAMAEAGLAVDDRLVISYQRGEGNQAWVRRLLKNGAKPDGVVWSDMGMAQVVWPMLAAGGLALGREDHVLAGQKHMVALRGFEGHPVVVEDIAALARAGVLLLKSLIAGNAGEDGPGREENRGMTVYIPFETANLVFGKGAQA